MCNAMREQLETLQQDYHDFNASVIPLLPYPTAVQFCKQVSKGRPCLYQLPAAKAVDWPALSWTLDDITSRVQAPLEVAVTPDGNADSLIPHPRASHDILFVQPATILLTLKQLMSKLSPLSEHGPRQTQRTAYYLQSQNSNLTSTPLTSLLQDLQPNFEFAEEVLGEPDARNIWIGDNKSVTSIHRDPYENLYLVLKGEKTFRLWPPVDELSMPTRMVCTGRYKYSDLYGEPAFDVETDDGGEMIPWVDFDPLAAQWNTDAALYGSLLENMHQITVKEGQILFLPSGWYHHVTQECGEWDDGSRAPCIAVNYWYDQEYDGDGYVLRQLVSRMVEATRTTNL